MYCYENKNLKFDTVKIWSRIEYFKGSIVSFTPNIEPNGKCTGMYYSSKKDKSVPYNLFVGINYNSQSLTLEFSSKILLDDYPKLITKDTFRQCLENINELGICTIDVDAIINDCYFSDMDITNDIDYILTDKVLSSLNLCVNNYRRYKMKPYGKTGITFNKDVKKESDISLTIYNKEIELELSKNKKFLSLTNNPDAIKEYFRGKVRFEMTLDNPNKICDFLNIENTHINNVFNSKVNPLLTQFNLIFGNGEIMDKSYIKNCETYEMMKNLQSCKGDLKVIEQELKDYNIYSSRSGITDKMKKYKQLHTEMYSNTHNSTNILAKIREKLS